MSYDLSVIIPVFNRQELIRHTLASVTAASVGVRMETIIVDDGSNPPASSALQALGFSPTQLIRQENRGLLYARLAGLQAATGRHVLFLDSDDLVSSEKFSLQLAAHESTGAEVTYSETAQCVLADSGPTEIKKHGPALDATDSPFFHITVQPAPHSPMYRREYLNAVVARPTFPPSPLYNSVAEIWFYHNASVCPARVVKVSGAYAIVGVHPEGRLTSHWEKLGVASLAVMEAFARSCPQDTPTAQRTRQLVAEKAFGAWRRLPRGFSPEFSARLLGIWQRLHTTVDLGALGGSSFKRLATLLGPTGAARLLQPLQNDRYEKTRTMDSSSFTALLSALPPP